MLKGGSDDLSKKERSAKKFPCIKLAKIDTTQCC